MGNFHSFHLYQGLKTNRKLYSFKKYEFNRINQKKTVELLKNVFTNSFLLCTSLMQMTYSVLVSGLGQLPPSCSLGLLAIPLLRDASLDRVEAVCWHGGQG